MKLIPIGRKRKPIDIPGEYHLSVEQAAQILNMSEPRIWELHKPFVALVTEQSTGRENVLAMNVWNEFFSMIPYRGDCRTVGAAYIGRYDTPDTVAGLTDEDIQLLQEMLDIVREIMREQAHIEQLERNLDRLHRNACGY